MSKTLFLMLGLSTSLVLVSLPGCKEKKKLREDEDLKAVVAADRQLADKEQQIMRRRGALQRERKRIQDKRVELQTKRASLVDGDENGRQALEQEESKLASLEASLVKQEIGLNNKLQSLLDDRTQLVGKLTKEKGGGTRELLVTRREYSVALREKDLSRREADLARREKGLATREQTLAARQANICSRGQTVVMQAPASPSRGGSYTRKDVEPVFRAALRAMREKGILIADLPPGVDRLVTETRHGVSKGDYVRAKYSADQLLATVRTMKIDRTFIGAKIGRLSQAIRSSKPSVSQRDKVNKLFQEATANYGDGRFIAANRKLNRIYAQLR